jgi:hypothetical protein
MILGFGAVCILPMVALPAANAESNAIPDKMGLDVFMV